MKERKKEIKEVESASKQKKSKKASKQVPEKTRRSMLTAFVLLFPSLVIVSLMGKLPFSVYAIALFFYQAVLIKSFIDDYYRNA